MAKRRKKRAGKAARDTSQVELLPGLAADAMEETTAPPKKVVESTSPVDERPDGQAAPAGSSVQTTGNEMSETDIRDEPELDGDVTVEASSDDRTTELAGQGEHPGEAGDADVPPPAPRPQGNQLSRARDLVQSGRIEEAIEQYMEILGENPQNLRAHNNLGILYDELGQHDTAVEHLEAALEVEPENVEVLTNLASAFTKLARFDAADTSIRQALRLAPDDPAARLAQGILSFRRGLYPQSEVELRWVCERDANVGEAFYYRGEALNRTGHFAEATELMLRAAELLPEDARPFYTLGHLYDRQSRPVEAAEMYRRARDLQAS